MSARFKRITSPLLVSFAVVALIVAFACTGDSKAKEKPNYKYSEGALPGGAAMTIDGKPISWEQMLGDRLLDHIEAAEKLYEVDEAAAGQTVINTVYAEEAKKANMSVDEYVNTKVLKGEPKISDGEYNKFVQEKKIPKEQLNPQLKERILAYMKMQKREEDKQKLITKLVKDHNIVLGFKKPEFKVNVDIGDSPTFGGKDAKVKIVEFSDFQCPFCSRAAATVTQLKKMYGNKILVAFKQYPLPMHPQAKPASEASLCVNEQSTDKFWKFHDKLFENQQKLDDKSLADYAKAVGANMDQFNKCVAEKKYAKAVEADMDQGNKLNVRSTPSFFINGKPLSGAQPVEAFKEIIDDQLASK